MKNAVKLVLIFSIVSVLALSAYAAPKGGLPELWRQFEQLTVRVASLEASSGSGLLARVTSLEQRVAVLEQENNELKIETELLQLQLTSINSIPIETARRLHQQGDFIIVDPSSQTLGDYLNGFEVGELILLNDNRFGDLESLFEPGYVQCEISGNSPFVNDRSPNSTGVTRNYTHTKNITGVNQHQNWTNAKNGTKSCVPAGVTSAIEYWNRTLRGFGRNMTLFNITDRLHRMMGTTPENGTSISGFIHGITVWINRTGYAKNMTVTIRGAGVRNGSSVVNGVNTSGIEGTGDAFNPVNIQMILEEFINKNEFVMLIVEHFGAFHAVAIHSISNTPNSNGNYDVALMDPETGEIVETEIEPDGDICVEYDSEGNCVRAITLQQIWSISLVSD